MSLSLLILLYFFQNFCREVEYSGGKVGTLNVTGRHILFERVEETKPRGTEHIKNTNNSIY